MPGSAGRIPQPRRHRHQKQPGDAGHRSAVTISRAHQAATVFVSVTTLDPNFAKVMEPRTSRPQSTRSHHATDPGRHSDWRARGAGGAGPDRSRNPRHHLGRRSRPGPRSAGYVTLRLPYAVAPLFEQWLTQHFPGTEGKGPEPHPQPSRRQIERRPIRLPHARRRHLCRSD